MSPFMYYYSYFISYGFAVIIFGFAIFKKCTKKAFVFHSVLHFLVFTPIIIGKEIVKAIYMNTDYDYLKKIQAQITDLTGDMDVSFSSNRYMEFNRKGVSKGKGLHKLADLLGVDIKDTIAIGDNYNDLSMIKEAGLGIGVANTVEAMKKECDYITKADCDHSAIAEVINRFIFNEGN